jgi:hypothetical protein
MPHAARQPRSWLIFDVRQKMKAVLREYDVVRVVRLEPRAREYTSSEGYGRDPRVGDIGTIVHDYGEGRDDRTPVCVECSAESGHCIWLADFERDELEFVARAPDEKTA